MGNTAENKHVTQEYENSTCYNSAMCFNSFLM